DTVFDTLTRYFSNYGSLIASLWGSHMKHNSLSLLIMHSEILKHPLSYLLFLQFFHYKNRLFLHLLCIISEDRLALPQHIPDRKFRCVKAWRKNDSFCRFLLNLLFVQFFHDIGKGSNNL